MKNSLLEKMRKIHSLLQINGTDPVVFDDFCNLIGRLLSSNVTILSRKGKVLGMSLKSEDEKIYESMERSEPLDNKLNKLLLSEIMTNENLEMDEFSLAVELTKNVQNDIATVVPMMAAGDRIGTVLVYRGESEYTEEDIILLEYAATVVGLEILRTEEKESADQIRKETVVKSAIGTLSYSELEAVLHIFGELEGMEGLLVASKIADKVGITRSVIVNALRKFESAGVVECRSLGMKGTYIKVLNEILLEELNQLRNN